MNAVERGPVETRVLNPTASEANYKPKQRSYRKTNIRKKVLAHDSPVTEMSSAVLGSAYLGFLLYITFKKVVFCLLLKYL